MPKYDFESTNFANFDKVVHNFGSSAYFKFMQTWFNAKLDKKINGRYLFDPFVLNR